jgi:hypothetical protein
MRVVYDGPVFVEYGQAALAGEWGPAELDEMFAGQVQGLCGTAVPGLVQLMTGTHTGDVMMRVELHDSEPTYGDGWEDVVEASWTSTGGRVVLAGLMGAPVVELDLPPGDYRVRYAGRDMDHERDEDLPPDTYLLQVWPAPSAPDVVLRETSGVASYWHAYVRGDPPPPPPPLIALLLAADLSLRDRVLIRAVRAVCGVTGLDADPEVSDALDLIEVAARTDPGHSWLEVEGPGASRASSPGRVARQRAFDRFFPTAVAQSQLMESREPDLADPVYRRFQASLAVDSLAQVVGLVDAYPDPGNVLLHVQYAVGEGWAQMESELLLEMASET